LDKAGFNSKISQFFQNYLVGRKTKYFWNNFFSPLFNVDIGVGQGSALSPILSVLYLSSVFHILEKRLKILKILISVISFVDNSLFISQNKYFVVSNSNNFCSYWIMLSLLEQFGLAIGNGKMEVFYFSRTHRIFNPPLLDLTILGGSILHPKEMWHYLGFIFNRKLTFHQHINFYVNKAISTVKSMKILRNSSRELIPSQKHLLYRICILLITLYRFPLWF